MQADESLSDEQDEEVTEPSEEDSEGENPEDKEGDITSEDPSDEDPATEEPTEGDVEEPVEEDGEDTLLGPDQATIMEGEGLYPNIDNDQKDKWTLKAVTVTAAGKKYYTVGKVGEGTSAYDTFVDPDDNTKEATLDTTDLADKYLAFDVELNSNYKFKSTDKNEQVKADLKTAQQNGTTLKTLKATYKTDHYEIDLNEIKDVDFGGNKYPNLTVWVDYEEKTAANAISLSDDTDEATVTIGDTDISEAEDGYPITDTTKDIEAAVSVTGKMFEVMYKPAGDNATWTSALKKGQAANKPFADRAVSYGSGTYIIPKAALTGNVEVKVLYLNEIALNWEGDANWNSVGITATAQRVQSSSTDNKLAIFGAQYAATKDEKKNVLFVPQETKVSLALTANEGKGFTFTTVSYKKAGENSTTPGTIDETDKFKASLEIANTGKNSYTVVVEGTSTTYEKTTVVGEDGKEVPLSKKAGTIEPRTEYTIEAFMYSGKTYPIDDIEVKVGSDDAKEKGWVVVTADEEDDEDNQGSTKPTGTFTLKATKDAAEKTLTVTLKDKEEGKTIDTLSLKVAPVIKSVAVSGTGVKTDAKDKTKATITQSIGTSANYVITPTSSQSKDVLVAKVANGSGALDVKGDSIELTKDKTGKWTMPVTTTAMKPDDDVATIKIYNEADMAEDAEAEGADTAGLLMTLTVNTTVPTWAVVDGKGGKAPAVKLNNATDVDLFLDLTVPQGVDLEKGTYYYKVTVTPDDKNTEGLAYVLPGEARYYAVENAATMKQRINAINKTLSQGANAKFNVEVELVQYAAPTSSGSDDGDDGDGGDGGGDDNDNPTISSYTNVAGVVVNDDPEGGESGNEGNDPSTDPAIVNTDGRLAAEPAGTLIATSAKATLKNAATKTPYHADKITLKKEKAASGVYTGQKDALVATVDFGKAATYISKEDVKVEVQNNEKVEGDKDAITATINENCQVILGVEKGATPGKYKIKVTQTNSNEYGNLPSNAIQATATMDVTVVKGIETLVGTTQSATQILVTPKKDGAAKITPVYNDGIAAAKPKTAKVDYQVGTVANGTFTPASGVMAQYITAKGGSVKISKKYAEELEKDGSTLPTEFAVKVIAKDYDTSDVETRLDFSIATKAQKLGKVVLVAIQNDKTYNVVKTTDAITADVAEGYYVRVLQDGVTKETGLSDGEDGDFVDPSLYTLKLSKKGLTVDSNGAIQVDKVVDKLKISATATDGGNEKSPKNQDLELSVTYAAVAEESLVFTDGKTTFDADKKALVNVPTGTVINLKARGKVSGTNSELDLSTVMSDYPINYNKIVAVKGAKIVTSEDSLNVGIQMTAKEATVKLAPQQKKIGSTTYPELVYTITNNNFDTATLKKGLKVSLAKGKKIYADYHVTGKKQTVNFTTAAWKDLPDGVTEAVVKVSAVDAESQKIVNKIDGTNDIVCTFDTAKKTGAFTITFDDNIDVIKKATLYFDFYKEDKTTLISQTVTLSAKTEVLKKSYKLTNKYSMSARDAAKVTLKESGKPAGITAVEGKYNVEFTELLNANLKGTVNEFTEAFALEEVDGKKTNRLLLVDDKKASKTYGEDKQAKVKGINNLTGFVKYTVTYDDGDAQDYITQITIDRKDAKDPKKTVQTPKASKATVLAEAGITATTKITAGKDAVKLVGAEYTGDSEENIVLSMGTDDGIVNLQFTAAPTSGTIKGTLRVIPESSFVAKEAAEAFQSKDTDTTDDAAESETKKDWKYYLDNYGIDVKIDIVVKAVAKTKGKVKVDNLKPSFKDATLGENGKYTMDVTYTSLIAATVSNIEADTTLKNNKPLTPDCIKISKGDGKFTITIDKAEYASYVRESKKGTNYTLYNKAVEATVKFTFAATGAEAESYKLTITPPTLTIPEIEDEGSTENPGTITAVVITTPTADQEVEKGATVTCEGKATGTGTLQAADEAVTWELVAPTNGQYDAATKFGTEDNTKNVLEVGTNEQQETIVIKATSVSNPSVSKTVTIKVKQGTTQV